MKVKELISLLSKLNPEAEIRVAQPMHNYTSTEIDSTLEAAEMALGLETR